MPTKDWERDRIAPRKNFLGSLDFQSVVDDVNALLGNLRWCLIGGLAMAAHANPKVTVDTDVLVDATYESLATAVRRIPPGHDVRPASLASHPALPRHLFVMTDLQGRTTDLMPTEEVAYLRSVVRRSELKTFRKTLNVWVAKAEDIIVIKTILSSVLEDRKAATKHARDAVNLVGSLANRLDRRYVDRKIDELM